MPVQRDSQFMEWAKLVQEEQHTIELEGLQKSWHKLDVYRRQREALARRTHDLAWFIVKQTYRGESKPGEMLYLDGEPVTIIPDNLAEWFKNAPFLADYDGLLKEVKVWVEQDLGWKRDEIIGFHIENEVLYHGIDDKGNKLHTQGKHVSVTMQRGQEAQSQEFIRGDNGWQKIK
jgi:hypothetical protein